MAGVRVKIARSPRPLPRSRGVRRGCGGDERRVWGSGNIRKRIYASDRDELRGDGGGKKRWPGNGGAQTNRLRAAGGSVTRNETRAVNF